MKRRYFVLKDGYLPYYSKPKPDSVNKFDVHPKGVLPWAKRPLLSRNRFTVARPTRFQSFKDTSEFWRWSLIACVEGEANR